MIGFGASFGFTVMARVSLFINRMQFLDNSWIAPAFDTTNAAYNWFFPTLFWFIILGILVYIVKEFMQFMKRRAAGETGPAQ
jgi:hypothetical protein